MKKVLVLAAHPDDETLGCGGTIHRLYKEGCQIQLLTFTDGESSRGLTTSNRNKLLEKISSILGIFKYNFSNFPDNSMDTIPLLKLCKFIESNVDYSPDIIFTHHQGDLNVDHVLVAKATYTVFRPQYGNNHKILNYYIPSSTDYNPTSFFKGNTFYRLSNEDFERKIDALKVYDKEMREYPHSRSYKNLNNLSSVWGSEVGTDLAEKFINIREVL